MYGEMFRFLSPSPPKGLPAPSEAFPAPFAAILVLSPPAPFEACLAAFEVIPAASEPLSAVSEALPAASEDHSEPSRLCISHGPPMGPLPNNDQTNHRGAYCFYYTTPYNHFSLFFLAIEIIWLLLKI